MKYIRSIQTEFVEEMLKVYELAIDLDSMDTYSVAKSVYDACEKIMPQNLIGILKLTGRKKELEEDIIQHMVFNTYMISEIKKNGFIESNHNECKKTVEELEKCNGFINTRQVSNYKKILDGKVGDYFDLKKVLEDNKSFN
jgi:hypothetical protein